MRKDLFGIPVWIWGIGAVVVVGGYLWIKHQQSTAAASSGTGTGAGAGTVKSTDNLNEQIKDFQSPPAATSGTPTPPANPGGPERKWLISKTGSQHPWSFLAQHHERVVVGPTGSRKIVGGSGG